MKKHQRLNSCGMLKVMLGASYALQLSVTVAYGGWNQVGAGPYDYLNVANWDGGTIDNTCSPMRVSSKMAQANWFCALEPAHSPAMLWLMRVH